jgi:hypothetical protein
LTKLLQQVIHIFSMAWPNWVATVPSCVNHVTRGLRRGDAASSFALHAYPLGWRTYGVPRAIELLRSRGFDAWADGDVVHATLTKRHVRAASK